MEVILGILTNIFNAVIAKAIVALLTVVKIGLILGILFLAVYLIYYLYNR